MSNLPWTVELVKKELPNVSVKVGIPGKIVTGRVTGRLNQFATVTVDNNFPRSHVPNWYDFKFSWESIVHSLNNETPLLV